MPGFNTLDRTPTLPPEVQPSTFSSLAGQEGGAPGGIGDTQVRQIVGSTASMIEMGAIKLGQLTPGSENVVSQIRSLVRQLAIQALMGQGNNESQGQPPMNPAMQGPSQSPQGMMGDQGGNPSLGM